MTEPDFLSDEDVAWIHAAQLALYGGREGVRDAHLLASAVAMAQQTFAPCVRIVAAST